MRSCSSAPSLNLRSPVRRGRRMREDGCAVCYRASDALARTGGVEHVGPPGRRLSPAQLDRANLGRVRAAAARPPSPSSIVAPGSPRRFASLASSSPPRSVTSRASGARLTMRASSHSPSRRRSEDSCTSSPSSASAVDAGTRRRPRGRIEAAAGGGEERMAVGLGRCRHPGIEPSLPRAAGGRRPSASGRASARSGSRSPVRRDPAGTGCRCG